MWNPSTSHTNISFSSQRLTWKFWPSENASLIRSWAVPTSRLKPYCYTWSTVTATGFIYIYIYIYIYLSIHPSIYLSIYLYYICGNLSHHIISTIQSSTTIVSRLPFKMPTSILEDLCSWQPQIQARSHCSAPGDTEELGGCAWKYHGDFFSISHSHPVVDIKTNTDPDWAIHLLLLFAKVSPCRAASG